MIKFSSLLLSALLLGFQLTGLEKVFELKGPLDMTGVKKVIPVHPEFNFTPDQSFTAELKYRQDAPNPDKAYSSSILACGFWRMKAANKFGTPIFNASGRFSCIALMRSEPGGCVEVNASRKPPELPPNFFQKAMA